MIRTHSLPHELGGAAVRRHEDAFKGETAAYAPYRCDSGNCSSRSRSSGRIISPISWLFVLAVLGSKLADRPKIAEQFGVTSRGLLQIASQCPSSAW
jgi:hypothetical protein